jgi:hypothetical protein
MGFSSYASIFLFPIVFICFLDQGLGMVYSDTRSKVMDSDREIEYPTLSRSVFTVAESSGYDFILGRGEKNENFRHFWKFAQRRHIRGNETDPNGFGKHRP